MKKLITLLFLTLFSFDAGADFVRRQVAPKNVATTNYRYLDDVSLIFGTDSDCDILWSSSTDKWQFRCTDVDGAGTDGVVFDIQSGTDDLEFTGDILAHTIVADNLADPTDIFTAKDNGVDVFDIRNGGFIKHSPGAAGGAGTIFDIDSTITNASGVVNVLEVDGTINASGTAEYRGLFVNITETATGSGDKLPILVHVGGIPLFSIDGDGVVTISEAGGDDIDISHNGTDAVFTTSAGVFQFSDNNLELNSGVGANGSANLAVKADTDNSIETAVAGIQLLNDGTATHGFLSMLGSNTTTSSGVSITNGVNGSIVLGGMDSSVTGVQIAPSATVIVDVPTTGDIVFSPTSGQIKLEESGGDNATLNLDGTEFIISNSDGGIRLVPSDSTFYIGASGMESLLLDNTGLYQQAQNGKGTNLVSSTTTSGAASSDVATIATSNDNAITVKGSVQGIKDDGSEAGFYTIDAGYKNDGGVLTESFDNTAAEQEDDVNWDCVIAPNSSNIEVTCTGAAGDDINWSANLEISVAS